MIERAGSARKHNIYKTYLREWEIGSIRLFESLHVQRNDTECKLLWLTVKYVIVYSNAFQNKRLNVRITLPADCLYIRLCCCVVFMMLIRLKSHVMWFQ